MIFKEEDYTKSQVEVIKSEQKRLLVSASAGSGKTRVLITRILHILDTQHIDLSNMLIVTFTNLASLEMKSRLRDALEKNSNDEFLRSQLDELNVANISTLHKFCQNLIKEYFYEVQIEPNFNLLDEKQSLFYKNKAIDNVIKTYADNFDLEFSNLYEIFNESRNDKKFKENILNIYEFLKSKTDNFLDNIFDNVYCEDYKNNIAVQYVIKRKNILCDYFIEELNKCLIEARQLNFDEMIESLEDCINNIKKFKDSEYYEIGKIFKDFKFSVYIYRKNEEEKKECYKKAHNLVLDLNDKFEKLIVCFKPDEDSFKDNIIFNKTIIKKFCEIIDNFEKEYKKLKFETNSLDFNDLEHYALRILSNKTIAEELQKKYKYIFVDEYQDTNEVQESIIQKLTSDNFVFMVGDVKQSIYMFRNCNPQIFINKSLLLSKENENQVKLLNKNFRSDKDILDFNNLVFNNIMTNDTSNLDYENTAKFEFGEKFTRSYSNLNRVNICLIDKQKEKEEITFSNVYSVLNDKLVVNNEDNLKNEAIVISRKIQDLLNCEIYDDDIKQNRKIRYSDIAVLVRTKNAIKQLSQNLKTMGLPITSQFKTNIFETYEIKLIVSILKLISNYYDDYSLCGVLKSVVVNLSDSELEKIKNSYSNKFYYQNVLNYLKDNNDEISSKLKTLFSKLDLLRQKQISLTVDNLINEIILDFNIKEKLYNFDNYLECLQNIEYLISIAKTMSDKSLSSFISYIDNMMTSNEVDIDLKDSLNSIYIGTIHSSKGLEYPVVFLAHCNRKFSNTSLSETIVKNGEFGLGISSYDIENKITSENIVKNAIKLKISEDERKEEFRMLYVALTRAKNYLYVLGDANLENIKEMKTSFEISNSHNYLDLIVGSLSSNDIYKINNKVKQFKSSYNDLEINFETYEESDFNSDDEILSKEFNSKLNKKDIDEVQNYIDKKFSNNDYIFKNSVTALMELEREDNYNITDLKQTKFDFKNQDEDFMKTGTIYHKIMELIDLKQSTLKDIELQVNNFVSDNIISSEDLKNIDLEVILNAVNNVSTLINEDSIVLREQQFMSYLPLNEILNTDSDEKVLIQGVVDLMIINLNNITLLDYKTTSINNAEKLKQKYALQLKLYQKAIESFYGKKVDKKIIYSFYAKNIINV